jgi:transcriptional regulator with GAF, ATPase, and Fis domain
LRWSLAGYPETPINESPIRSVLQAMAFQRQLDEIIKLLCNVMEAFTAAFFLVDDKKRSLYLASFYSLSKNIVADVSLGFEEGLVGWIAKNQRPVNAKGFDRDTTTLGYYSVDEEIKSFMGVPMGNKGVLCVDSKKTYVFTEKDQKILSGFGDVIFDAMVMSEVLSKERADYEFLRLLLSIEERWRAKGELQSSLLDVLSLCSETLEVPNAAIIELTERKREFAVFQAVGLDKLNLTHGRFPREKGLVDWVFNNNKPLVFDSFHFNPGKTIVLTEHERLEKVKSLCLLPLSPQGTVIGVFCLFFFKERTLNKYPKQHLFFLADLVGLILQNKRHFHLMERIRELDPVTGVWNSTSFYHQFAECFNRSKEYNMTFPLILLELEGLERLVFRWGRVPIREILLRITEGTRGVFGQQAVIGRFNDGGFAVFIEGVHPAEARQARKRLMEHLEKRPFLIDGQEVHLSLRDTLVMFKPEFAEPLEMWQEAKNQLIAKAIH